MNNFYEEAFNSLKKHQNMEYIGHDDNDELFKTRVAVRDINYSKPLIVKVALSKIHNNPAKISFYEKDKYERKLFKEYNITNKQIAEIFEQNNNDDIIEILSKGTLEERLYHNLNQPILV